MTFKKGAFKDFKPIKIFCFKYSADYFMPFNDLIPRPLALCMLLCNLSNSVEITEFEGVYDPKNIKGLDFKDRAIIIGSHYHKYSCQKIDAQL